MAVETVFLYFFILAMLRWSGKRSLGNMAPFDFVVIIMAGEAAALALEEQKGVMHAVVPIAVLAGLEVLVALTNMKSRAVERVTQGTPTVLVQGGRIDFAALRKERLTQVDLKSLLRDKDVDDLAVVQEARLEPTGRLTVTLYPAEKPLTIKTAGPVLSEHIMPQVDERLAALEARLLARLGAGAEGGKTGGEGAPPSRADADM
jgi:uncharacterized membrane protein YcaP (DUF421 family)